MTVNISKRRSVLGFTLVELMVVTVIVGVLAALGIAAMRRHVYGSKASEALNGIQNIRAAQESWRAEHMQYLDVSTAQGGWYPFDPTLTDGRTRSAMHNDGHFDWPRWKMLRIVNLGTRDFGYQVNAGPPTQAMTPLGVAGFSWPAPSPGGTQREFWYVIRAIADSDKDGTSAFYAASNIKGDIFRQNEGE